MRLHSEELSNQRTRVEIAYEHNSEQIDVLHSELDQMRSALAKKVEQIKKLLQERDDIVKEYEVCRLLLFFCSNTQLCICSNWLCFLCRDIDMQIQSGCKIVGTERSWKGWP